MSDRKARAAALKAALICVAEASGAEWRPLWSIAKRESAADYLAEHKLEADRKGSLRALQRNRDRLFKGNPYLAQLELWDRGRGPFGMMPANHLHRWDPLASPMVMHDPWIASVMALRLVERHRRNGADTWAKVNEGWASGRVNNQSAGAASRAERFRARLASDGWGHLADAEPRTGSWGTGPQADQATRLAAIAARCTGEQVTDPPDPTEPPLTRSAGGIAAALAAIGTLGIAAGAAWLWWPTKRSAI